MPRRISRYDVLYRALQDALKQSLQVSLHDATPGAIAAVHDVVARAESALIEEQHNPWREPEREEPF